MEIGTVTMPWSCSQAASTTAMWDQVWRENMCLRKILSTLLPPFRKIVFYWFHKQLKLGGSLGYAFTGQVCTMWAFSFLFNCNLIQTYLKKKFHSFGKFCIVSFATQTDIKEVYKVWNADLIKFFIKLRILILSDYLFNQCGKTCTDPFVSVRQQWPWLYAWTKKVKDKKPEKDWFLPCSVSHVFMI